MKKILLMLVAVMPLYSYAQAINVNTSTHSVPSLVTDVLINSPCTQVSNISWRTGTNFGLSNGIGYFENTNPSFPMQSGVILSTGDVANAPGPNNSTLSDGNNAAWVGDTDLENVLQQAGIQMNSVNATVLEFDFIPVSANFSFDFLFASEEYGNFQCDFSDAFAFLLTNQNSGQTTNLAVIPNTNTPISVLTIRDFLYNSSCPSVNPEYFQSFNGGSEAMASPINYNGETVVFQATSTLIPNTPYHIKLVIADRSDYQFDSAIFLSSNSFNVGQEVLGADLTIGNNTAICFDGSTNLTTGLDPNNYSFVWRKDGQIVAGQTDANLIVTSPGTYSVTYNNTIMPCEVSVTDSIVVEFYPQFLTPNPENIYKCNTGQSSYNFNLAYNTPIVTAGLNSGVSVSYHATQADANNNENLLPNLYESAGNETVFVRIQNTNGCATVKSFQLLLIAPPTATQPSDMTNCVTNFGGATAVFNFESQNQSVLNGLQATIFNISYHTSLEDAQTGQNPISSANYSSNGNVTIFVRLENKTDTDCFATTSFQIFTKDLPQVDILDNEIVCDQFELPTLTYGNYFTGTGGTGTPLFAGNTVTTTQTIYIYAESGGIPNCSNESSFHITVIDPESLTPPDGRHCTSYTLSGLQFGNYFTQPHGQGEQIPVGTVLTQNQTIYVYYQFPVAPFCVVDSSFDVEIIPFTPLPIFPTVFNCNSYTLPNLSSGNYYSQPNGVGATIPAGTTITSTQTIYVYSKNDICEDQKSFTIFIGIDTPADASNCSSYTLPNLPIGNYFTGPAGSGSQILAGTVITSTQTIYVYVATSETPNCTDNIHFQVTISQPFPTIPDDVTVCGSYELPSISVGNYYTGTNGSGTLLQAGQFITSTQRIYIYNPVEPGQNCTNEISYMVNILPIPQVSSRSDIGPICNPYTLTPLQVGNYYTEPGGNGTILPAGTVITSTQTIYIFEATDTNPICSAESSFTITIVGVEADEIAPVFACDSYILPSLSVGNYFTETGGNGTMLQAGQTVTQNQTIYIYAEIINRGIKCTDENILPITIVTTPVVNNIPASVRTICDEDETNDGITNFDLSILSDFALGTQDNTAYTVQYFESQSNAVSGTNPVTSTNLPTIYVKIVSTISNCHAIRAFALIVKRLPEPNIVGGTICIDSKTNELISSYTILTGLAQQSYSFQWFQGETLITNATLNRYDVVEPGFYTVIATNNSTGCSSKPKTVEVIRSEQATVTYEVSNEFNENQNITINATGIGGDYLYQMDEGPIQASPIFENVSSGEHSITVHDNNGCESTTITAFVINYPKYFTPNGDGFHDFWNIKDLAHQAESIIYIFDRFGKLITQIKPSQPGGWDGTFNGEKLFSTDYWFTVTYFVNGIQKEFKAHFAMKR